MSNVIAFEPRPHRANIAGDVIRKVINGEVVEYINFDALTPTEQQRLFSKTEEDKVAEAFAPQPVD